MTAKLNKRDMAHPMPKTPPTMFEVWGGEPFCKSLWVYSPTKSNPVMAFLRKVVGR